MCSLWLDAGIATCRTRPNCLWSVRPVNKISGLCLTSVFLVIRKWKPNLSRQKYFEFKDRYSWILYRLYDKSELLNVHLVAACFRCVGDAGFLYHHSGLSSTGINWWVTGVHLASVFVPTNMKTNCIISGCKQTLNKCVRYPNCPQ